MWRSIAIFVAGVVLGLAAGTALGFLLFPFVFPPAPATDQLTAAERTNVVAKGTFIQANASDPLHYGKGGVMLYKRTVFLEPDFEVGPGPDYHVYLVAKAKVRNASEVDGAKFIDLGKLRSFKGSQKYEIPAGVDPEKYPSVVIWCQQFGVLISPADLTFDVS